MATPPDCRPFNYNRVREAPFTGEISCCCYQRTIYRYNLRQFCRVRNLVDRLSEFSVYELILFPPGPTSHSDALTSSQLIPQYHKAVSLSL